MSNTKDPLFRLELAQAYKRAMSADIFPRDRNLVSLVEQETEAIVQKELNAFLSSRLEVLLGLKADVESIGLSPEDVTFLKALAKRLKEGNLEDYDEEEEVESLSNTSFTPSSSPVSVTAAKPGKTQKTKKSKKTKKNQYDANGVVETDERTPDGRMVFVNEQGRKFAHLVDPRTGGVIYKKDDKGKPQKDEQGNPIPAMTDITPVAVPQGGGYKPPPQSEQQLANILNSQTQSHVQQLEQSGGSMANLASYFINKA